ncbi:hypothetical protein HBH62_159080 [Parastagonospora nodorum]|nr:hypothetical protein HBH62_159080 [Parastagonospora nodorum]
MRLKKNVLRGLYRKIKLKRYASSNKRTPVILLLQLLTNNRTTLYSTSKTAPLLVCLSIATTLCRKVIAAYALNYLKLNSLRCSTLISIVLYNAIKEYYDNRTRKIIYFYSYTIEKDYNCAEKREDNILTIDKCRTSYSNKKDIEADEREKETKVQLRKLLEEIYNILLREFRRANNFIESIIYNDNKQDEFAILAEKYIIDNCIVYALALIKNK